MKIVVLSDVHGNLPALQAILADLDDFDPDQIVFAGDFTRGPFPNEVIDLLSEWNTHMILGNGDHSLLRYLDGQVPQEWRTCQQFGMLRWTARRLTLANALFLRSLPEQRSLALPGADAILVVHGSPRKSSESLSPNDLLALDHALESSPHPVLVCGHTHLQWSLRRNEKLVINPGAVAGTVTGPRAQYARMNWDGRQWQVDLRTVGYNLAALQQAFEDSGLLTEGGPLARGFLLTMETGTDFMIAFLHHAYHVARQNGWQGGPAVPDELWQQAMDTFCWDLPK